MGASSLGVEEAGKLGGLDPESRPVAAQVDDVERLPTHWCGYEGVDAVILSTSRPEIYRKLAADNARVQALDQWVRMGGRLVLCVGSQGDEDPRRGLAAAAVCPRPVREDGFAASDRSAGDLLRQPVVVPAGRRRQGGDARAAAGRRSRSRRGRESDLPLVIRTARGFGQVIFVAADLDQPPLSKWSDRPLLVARLLDLPTGRAEESKENAAMMHYGYSDLAGQLRSALDRFTGVRLVPFWLVAGLIVVYILLIGPGDYFFLRKVVGRMEWTWLTFPLIVALVCVGAYVLAYRLKGDQLRVNQIDLVDVDAASGRMRGTTWLNVFSPRMESFNFAVEPRWPDGRRAARCSRVDGLAGVARQRAWAA